MCFGPQVIFCRRRDFADVGGFDRTLPIMEDIDLVMRLHYRGVPSRAGGAQAGGAPGEGAGGKGRVRGEEPQRRQCVECSVHSSSCRQQR